MGLGRAPRPQADVTCARAHSGLLDVLDAWTDPQHTVLVDLGYEGEAGRLTCPIKKSTPPITTGRSSTPPRKNELTVEQRTINMLHSATRALAERGNSLLKTTFKALRRVSLCPWRIGAITAAALVLSAPTATAPHDQTATG